MGNSVPSNFEQDPEFRYFWSELALGAPPNWLVEAGSAAEQRAAAYREMVRERAVVAAVRGKAGLSLQDVVDEETTFRPLIRAHRQTPLFLSYVRRKLRRFGGQQPRVAAYRPADVRRWRTLPEHQQRARLQTAFDELPGFAQTFASVHKAANRRDLRPCEVDDAIGALVEYVQRPVGPVETAWEHYRRMMRRAFKGSRDPDTAARSCETMCFLFVPVWERVVRANAELAGYPQFLLWMDGVWPRDAATGLPAARPCGSADIATYVALSWTHWLTDTAAYFNSERAALRYAAARPRGRAASFAAVVPDPFPHSPPAPLCDEVPAAPGVFSARDRGRAALSRFWGVAARVGEVRELSGVREVKCLVHPARGYRATVWGEVHLEDGNCVPCARPSGCYYAADIMRDVDAREFGLVLAENVPVGFPERSTLAKVHRHFVDGARPEKVRWFDAIYGTGLATGESESGNVGLVCTDMRKAAFGVPSNLVREMRRRKLPVAPLLPVTQRLFDVLHSGDNLVSLVPQDDFQRTFAGPEGFALFLREVVAFNVNMVFGNMRLLSGQSGRGMRRSVVGNARFLVRSVYRADLERVYAHLHGPPLLHRSDGRPLVLDDLPGFPAVTAGVMTHDLATFEVLRRTPLADNAILHFPCGGSHARGIEALLVRNYGMVGFTSLVAPPQLPGFQCIAVPGLLPPYASDTLRALRDDSTRLWPITHVQQIANGGVQ